MTEQLIILVEILLIDLVLAGDNAIIIGMVASKFEDSNRKKIILFLSEESNFDATIPIIMALSPAKTKSISIISINIISCSVILKFIFY